jgi:hypothetical protein
MTHASLSSPRMPESKPPNVLALYSYVRIGHAAPSSSARAVEVHIMRRASRTNTRNPNPTEAPEPTGCSCEPLRAPLLREQRLLENGATLGKWQRKDSKATTAKRWWVGTGEHTRSADGTGVAALVPASSTHTVAECCRPRGRPNCERDTKTKLTKTRCILRRTDHASTRALQTPPTRPCRSHNPAW